MNAVPNATGAGVTLVGNRGVKTSVAATSEAVLEADALQYHLNQGPCLDACLQAAPVHVDDLRLDHRWPAWTKAVRPLNIASLMSIPLVNSGRVQGAIKIYCEMPGAFDERATFLFGELAHTVALLLTRSESACRLARRPKPGRRAGGVRPSDEANAHPRTRTATQA